MKNIKTVSLLSIVLAAIILSGCRSTPDVDPSSIYIPAESLTLSEGDTIRITFAGAPDLNTSQQIRRDGKVTLPLLGEIKLAGLTPVEAEAEVLKTFGDQLMVKQVTVTVESGTYPVFISGAVLRPGQVTFDRPVTVLQAIMQAGGFDPARANAKAVRIIRHEEGKVSHLTVNVKNMLDGKDLRPFYLKASDIVFVPERFSWF